MAFTEIVHMDGGKLGEKWYSIKILDFKPQILNFKPIVENTYYKPHFLKASLDIGRKLLKIFFLK